MNYIDNNFKWLVKEIKSKTEDELYNHMKNKYLSLPIPVKDSLENFLNNFNYWGRLDYKNEIYEEIDNKVDTFYNHINDIEWLYEHLEDYRSKNLLFGILFNWYDYDFETLKGLTESCFCHYFDLDIISCNNETFVDLGAYIGDTTKDFIDSYGIDSYKRIYCYEMTQSTFNQLKNNLKKYPNIIYKNKAISNKKEDLYILENYTSSSSNTISETGKKIEATSLDIDMEEPITMIKMDIEGSEQKAINGAKNHIIKDHPKLLISVYHNHEDIWKIPKMINELCKDYKYYLRFYGNNLFPTEIVLFCK